ncbi:hypothetical protein BDV93DRAFT_519357 [Ceratobasidium sp. AG-I]|nr:hypothetical protein BDV93DRAFT_519357 [Ceratobasidium sp. AG-I]
MLPTQPIRCIPVAQPYSYKLEITTTRSEWISSVVSVQTSGRTRGGMDHPGGISHSDDALSLGMSPKPLLIDALCQPSAEAVCQADGSTHQGLVHPLYAQSVLSHPRSRLWRTSRGFSRVSGVRPTRDLHFFRGGAKSSTLGQLLVFFMPNTWHVELWELRGRCGSTLALAQHFLELSSEFFVLRKGIVAGGN